MSGGAVLTARRVLKEVCSHQRLRRKKEDGGLYFQCSTNVRVCQAPAPQGHQGGPAGCRADPAPICAAAGSNRIGGEPRTPRRNATRSAAGPPPQEVHKTPVLCKGQLAAGAGPADPRKAGATPGHWPAPACSPAGCTKHRVLCHLLAYWWRRRRRRGRRASSVPVARTSPGGVAWGGTTTPPHGCFVLCARMKKLEKVSHIGRYAIFCTETR